MKKRIVSLLAGAAMACVAPAHAATLLTEGFDGTGLPQGWLLANFSTNPASEGWFRPVVSSSTFAAADGASESYIASSVFVGATDADGNPTGKIDAILATPMVAMDSATVFTFSTRTVADNAFGDSLRIGAIVGGAFVDLGIINPSFAAGGYPDTWTTFQFSLPAQGEDVVGRFFIEYLVPDAGTAGDFIGVDSVVISAVPEPAPMALLALGGLGLLARRRRIRPALRGASPSSISES